MPCYDPGPTGREIRQTELANLLVYLGCCNSTWLPEDTRSAILQDVRANSYSGWNGGENLDKWTEMLCTICKSMTEEEENRLIYDGRNPKARKLADWWDEHKEMDKEREGKE